MTKQSTRQVITNKCILIVDEYGSIEIIIEGGNIYDGRIKISKEELIQTSNNSYNANKDGKRYTFIFYDKYMSLTIENTNNTTSEGKLSKVI